MSSKSAVIYARFSSDSQREESIEDQVRECTAYAKMRGFDVLKIYSDHALTGRTTARPDFLQMIEDAKDGMFDFVICYKTDRFVRNRYEAQKYKRILKDYGVKVVYAKVDIPTGPEGIILEGVLESLDEYYSANLSQNIKRGQFGNAQKCKTNGVRVFGLSADENDYYIINEHENIAVRKIFNMVIELRPDVEILRWLKQNGYKNTRGKDFTKSAISRIISNRKYIGEYSFGDVVIPGGIPMSIEEEIFIKANEVKKMRKSKRCSNTEFILSNVLYCGECGASMYGRSGTSKTGKKHFYYCCGNNVKKRCSKANVKKDEIENAIVEILNTLVFNDDVMNDILDGVMKYQEENCKNNNLQYLENNLKEVEKSLKNIVSAVEKGLFNETMIERMNNLDDEKKELERQIKLEKMDHQMLDRDFIKFVLNKFKTTEESTDENKKRLIETFVSKAFLFDEKLVLTFNYRKNGHLATYEEMLDNIQNARVREISFGGGEGSRTPVQK